MGKTTEEILNETPAVSQGSDDVTDETQTVTAEEVGEVAEVLPTTEAVFEQEVAAEAGLTTLGKL